MSLLPYAGEVLTELLDVFEPKDIAISSYGLREGLLYQQMSDDIRARDPLIEACKVSEMKDARVPGMGKTIFNFVRPLFMMRVPSFFALFVPPAFCMTSVGGPIRITGQRCVLTMQRARIWVV